MGYVLTSRLWTWFGGPCVFLSPIQANLNLSKDMTLDFGWGDSCLIQVATVELPEWHFDLGYLYILCFENYLYIYTQFKMIVQKKRALCDVVAVFSTWFKAQKSVPSTCPYWVGWTPTTFVRWVYKERDWWSQGHRNIGVIPKEKGRRNGFLGILMWHFASENDLRSRDFGQFHDHFLFLQEIDDIW